MSISKTRELRIRLLIVPLSLSQLILYYSFARCYHWEKLGKRFTRSLLFLSTDCALMVISKVKVSL